MSEPYVFLHGGGQGSWICNERIDALRLQGGEAISGTLTLDIPGRGLERGRTKDETTLDDIVACGKVDLQT